MDKNTGTETWTPRQQAAYEMLKASFAKNDALRAKALRLVEKAPVGGWTEADKIR